MKCCLPFVLWITLWTVPNMAACAALEDPQTGSGSSTSHNTSADATELSHIKAPDIVLKGLKELFNYFQNANSQTPDKTKDGKTPSIYNPDYHLGKLYEFRRNSYTKDSLLTFSLFEKMLSEEKIKLFLSILPDKLPMTPKALQFLGHKTVDGCLTDLYSVLLAANKKEKWAMEMVDAGGKPGSGMLRGDLVSLGNFDECKEVEVPSTLNFDTRYCKSYIWMLKVQNIGFTQPTGVKLGICLPDSCNAQEIELLINAYSFLRPDFIGGAFGTDCNHRDRHLPTSTVVVICFLSVIATILLVATVYDVFLKISKEWAEQNQFNCLGEPIASCSTSMKHVSERKPIISMEMQKGKFYSESIAAPNEKSDRSDIFKQALLCFSVYTNTSKLFCTDRPKGMFTCIDGLRFLTNTWVIIYHFACNMVNSGENWSPYRKKLYDRWTSMVIVNGGVPVDTFFAISGLLLTYLTLKELNKRALSLRYLGAFYFRRYWRLTPAYLIAILIYVALVHHLNDGPTWPNKGFHLGQCDNGVWWMNLLYIHNFSHKTCLTWTWFLAVDMQFYLISPLLILPMFFYGWRGLLSPLLFLGASAICAGVMTYVNDLPISSTLENWFDLSDTTYAIDFYRKPYNRMGAYIVGMMTGFLMHKYHLNETRIPKLAVVLGWLIAIATGLGVVYGPHGHIHENLYSTGFAAFYNPLNRIAFSMAVCWVIFTCSNGYGGFANTVLSWKVFAPLSKLAYCVYLTHEFVIDFFFYSQRKPFYIQDTNLVFSMIAMIFIAYTLGFVIHIGFEIPMARLGAVITARMKKTKV